jgi:hypothetical protein
MIWQQLCEGYEVSDAGDIRSVDRSVRNKHSLRPVKGRVLKPSLPASGYFTIQLGRGGPVWQVHVAVLTAFVGPRPSDDHEAAHINGVKTDNRLENLAWKTRVANQADRLRHGTLGFKLTEADILQIRERSEAGLSQSQIARQLGVSQVHVGRIINRKSWAACK